MALLRRMRGSAAWFPRPDEPGPGRAGFARRLAAIPVAVAAAILAVAGMLTPALAATGPSMMVNAGRVDIAVQGPNNSLLFYSAANGTSTWTTETVAGAGTTFSTPSMAADGNGIIIAAQGPNDSLMFYWTLNTTWHAETVAGAGTTFAAPSLATDGHSIDIAAVGPEHSLDSYYQVNGSSTWTAEVLTPPNQVVGAFSAPAIVIAAGNVYIAVESGEDTLSAWWQPVGGVAASWGEWFVGTTDSAPSITATGNTINISATSPLNGAVLFYWAFIDSSTWHGELVSYGNYATGTSIAADPLTNSAMIAAAGLDGHLELFSAVYGTGSWSAQLVSGAGTVSAFSPVPVINADYNDVNISVIGHAGGLLLDYSAVGSGVWNSEAVPGNGGAPHL